jgi:alkylation response protein AidB-like acyl-CoA dehydrogenase
MLLSLDADQEFFRETTAKFLTEQMPVAELRRRRDDPAGYDADFWRRGAELGWTSLLVDEEYGGGSISGNGLIDLTLVAYEIGAHASPGPFVPVNVVAAALSRTASHTDVLAGLLEGSAVATWCFSEATGSGIDAGTFEIAVDGSELILNGLKRPVESAGQASHLLVTGRTGGTGEGVTQVLTAVDTPGITITPLHSVDITRRFCSVTFDNVRVPAASIVGEVGQAAADVERQLQDALVMLTAESVGAMQTAFDITVQWAFDRYSFGRPLASYQALKHRFADMKSWLEGAHAISDESAAAVAAGLPQAAKLVSAAKAFIGEYGGELMQECVQFHGGLGVTFEHDLHLYLRRQTVDRALFGTPAQHRQRLATLDEQQEKA